MEDGRLIRFDTFEDLIQAIIKEKDLTVTVRQVCQALKAHRQWYDDCIKPFIKYAYVSNGLRGDHYAGLDFAKMLRDRAAHAGISVGMGEDDDHASVLISKESLYNIIKDAEPTATRQTIPVRLRDMLIDSQIQKIEAEADRVFRVIESEASEKEKQAVGWYETARCNAFTAAMAAYAPEWVKAALSGPLAKFTKRTDSPAVPIPVPDFDQDNFLGVIGQWYAPRDEKGYGDTDEDVARRIFKRGAIRILFRFRSSDGKIKEKILYTHDPYYPSGQPYPRGLMDSVILFRYAKFLQFADQMPGGWQDRERERARKAMEDIMTDSENRETGAAD